MARLLMAVMFLATIIAPAARTNAAEVTGINITMPEQVWWGHAPITFTITLVNTRTTPVSFELQIWRGGEAWGREDLSYSSSEGTEVVTGMGSEAGATDTWRGQVPAKGRVFFTRATFSGDKLGTFEFLRVSGKVGQYRQTLSGDITVIEGSGPPRGSFTVDGGRDWQRGTVKAVTLILWSPRKLKLYGTPIASPCLEGLPTTGYVMAPERTYQRMTFYLRVKADTLPGSCRLSTRIAYSDGNAWGTFTVAYTLNVTE